MKKLLFILPLFVITTLCSCAYKEPDGRYNVAALGFSDKGGCTVFAETVSVGTDISTASPRLFEATGKTRERALENLSNMFSKRMTLEHCAAVVIENDVKDKAEIFDFCTKIGINPSACVVKTSDAKKLLTATPERSAVGYDIMGIVRKDKQKTVRLFSAKDKIREIPVFAKYGDTAGVKAND